MVPLQILFNLLLNLLLLELVMAQETTTTTTTLPPENNEGDAGVERETPTNNSTLGLDVENSDPARCSCDVKYVGEYCGSVLNDRNPALNHCPADMFFCGKTNLGKQAVLLKQCNKGLACTDKINGGKQGKGAFLEMDSLTISFPSFPVNACYQRNRCYCKPEMRRRQKHCGTELVGPDCRADLVYRCPIIKKHSASPEDACPSGCEAGKCAAAV